MNKEEASKLMVRVFVSHSTKDFHLVTTLVKYLEAYGIEVYLAERDYQPGTQLSLKIMRNINLSDYFLVVYTINGDDSSYVQQEIGYWLGKRGNNRLIPFVESGINPKAFLRDVEYIEFDPLNPNIGVANVINYINQQIKMRRDQLIFDVGVGLGLVGFISLVLYGLSKLGDE